MHTALTTWDWLVTNREAIFRGIEFIGLIVGIAALRIAGVELGHVRKLADSTRKVLDTSTVISRDTAQIANSVSTQYVGEFPYNLSTLTDVLEQAKSHVEIMVDIAAYGHYSNPTDFLPYFGQLDRLAQAKDVQLRMIIYDEALNEAGRNDQFGGQAAFAALCEDPKFKDYFAKHKGDCPKDYLSFIHYLKLREDQRKEMLMVSEAEIKESNERYRFFMWLVDDKEAVFAFQVCGEHFREICFRTKDGNLIHTFGDLFRQSWASAKKVAA